MKFFCFIDQIRFNCLKRTFVPIFGTYVEGLAPKQAASKRGFVFGQFCNVFIKNQESEKQKQWDIIILDYRNLMNCVDRVQQELKYTISFY